MIHLRHLPTRLITPTSLAPPSARPLVVRPVVGDLNADRDGGPDSNCDLPPVLASACCTAALLLDRTELGEFEQPRSLEADTAERP